MGTPRPGCGAWRCRRARRAARGEARTSGGYGRSAFGRKCRSSAPREDRSRRNLGEVAGLVFARLDMIRTGALNRLGKLFQLGGEGLEFAHEETPLAFGDRLGRV